MQILKLSIKTNNSVSCNHQAPTTFCIKYLFDETMGTLCYQFFHVITCVFIYSYYTQVHDISIILSIHIITYVLVCNITHRCDHQTRIFSVCFPISLGK